MHIQRVDDPDNKEVRLYYYSGQREQKEQGINRRFCERFEAGLKNIADGLSKPRTEKRLDKLHERIGRLKEKSKGIGQHYDIELLPDDSGKKVVELRWTKQPQAGTRLSHPGVYCLRSNQTDWDSERLWRTYIMLTNLEAVFRSFKSELGLRPVYHQKKFASTATCSSPSWPTNSCKSFAGNCKNTASKAAGGVCGRSCPCSSASQRPFNVLMAAPLHIRKATRPEPELAAIYQVLNIDPLTGGVQKTHV